jgi:hypothetical protein
VLSRADLHADAAAVIGEDSADADFNTMKRDPWMWEDISHMLIHLSREEKELHPSGASRTKTNFGLPSLAGQPAASASGLLNNNSTYGRVRLCDPVRACLAQHTYLVSSVSRCSSRCSISALLPVYAAGNNARPTARIG